MYALEAFLSLVADARVRERRRARRAAAGRRCSSPTLALMVYSHNWALFFCLALAVATVLYGRERLREFALVAPAWRVLYAPWLPTLLTQARHTGAPWSTKPSFHELLHRARRGARRRRAVRRARESPPPRRSPIRRRDATSAFSPCSSG